MRLTPQPDITLGKLHDDYLRGKEELASLLGGLPFDPASFKRRARWLDERYAGERVPLSEGLLDYNQRLGAPERVLDNAARLRSPSTLVVVGGQQPGVCTGPLYTVYKAATVIRLAAKLEGRLDRPVIPCFWLASEDHDFHKICRLSFLDARGRPSSAELPADECHEGYSVGEIPPGENARTLLERLEEGTPDTGFKAEIMSTLRTTLEEARSLGEWCGRLMMRLFGDWGLVMIDPMEKPFRALSAPVIRLALSKGRAWFDAVEDSSRQLELLGYPLQLKPTPGHSGLFMYTDGRRQPLFYREGDLVSRDGSVAMPVDRALIELERRPELFSPNVAFRPLVQDWVLPCVAAVTGPNETAYLAQLRGLYSELGIEPPVRFPRFSGTILEPGVAELLDRYGLTLGEVLRGTDAALAEQLKKLDPVGIDRLFEEQKSRFERDYRKIIEAISVLDGSLRDLGETNLGRIMSQIQYLEEKAVQRLKKQNQSVLRHFEVVKSHLVPGGEMQERVYNPFGYLIKYGPGLLRELTERLPLRGVHYLVETGS